MKQLFTLFTFLLLTTTYCQGQIDDPLILAKIIFGKDSFPDLDKHITGEYNGHPNGTDLLNDVTTNFLLLGQDEKTAVVNLSILDSTGKGLDTYLHFQKDSIWKIYAFRTLAMTGWAEQAKNNLEKMSIQEVDEQVEKSKKLKNKEDSGFSSREDYYFELGNARLILELDDNIVKHFLTNKAEFERMKKMAIKELESKKSGGERPIKLGDSLRSEYRKLFISSISYGDYELGENCLAFSIGGMLDNTLGYLYVSDKKDLPEMSDSNVIMIREIGNGWYMYKTT